MSSSSAFEVVVVGAGAAGLLAAIQVAERGRRTLLLEKNRKPGVKILMSGGTRCNITHATDNRGIIDAYGPPGKFLHSALAAFSVADTVRLFEDEGVLTKREATGKIFPVSNKAAHVLAALFNRLSRTSCAVALDEPLIELRQTVGGFELLTSKRTLGAKRLILTTGGQSYPGCGTTGDGYRWAQELGHTLVPPRPALVPITIDVPWVRALQGITVPDVTLQVLERNANASKDRILARRRSSLLFAHFGLSGPAALDVSRAVSAQRDPQRLRLEIDLLPGVCREAFEESLASRAAQQGKRPAASILPEQLPARLLSALLKVSQISVERRCAEFSKIERSRLVDALKRLTLPVSGTLGFEKAEVTAGGIALPEIDSRTMQSKLVANLYLAGEILDLDGPIGGFNFQAAWSTGYLAGRSAAGD